MTSKKENKGVTELAGPRDPFSIDTLQKRLGAWRGWMGADPPPALSQGLWRMVPGGDIWICEGLRAQEPVEDPRGS